MFTLACRPLRLSTPELPDHGDRRPDRAPRDRQAHLGPARPETTLAPAGRVTVDR